MKFCQTFFRKELTNEQALAQIGILRNKIAREAKELGVAGSRKDKYPESTLLAVKAANRRFTRMKDLSEKYGEKFSISEKATAQAHLEKAKNAIVNIKTADEPAKMKHKAIHLVAGPTLIVLGLAIATVPSLQAPGLAIAVAGYFYTVIAHPKAFNRKLGQMGFARLQELKEMAGQQIQQFSFSP